MLILAGLLVMLLPWSPGVYADDGQGDAAIVFCMDPMRQNDLINAGIALGLGTPSTTPRHLTVGQQELDVPTWRNQRRSDFDRTCAALFQATNQNMLATTSSGWFTPWIPLAGVVVGALLTLLATTWRERVARGRIQADALRTNIGDFIRSGESYLDGWVASGARPDDGPVRTERSRVFDGLAPIRVAHPRWAVVKGLRDMLTAGSLGDDMTTGWARLDADRRVERVRKLRTQLDELRDRSNRLASAIGRPIRSWLYQRAYKAGRKP